MEEIPADGELSRVCMGVGGVTLSSVGVGLGELSSVEEMGVAVEVAVLTGESLDSTDVVLTGETPGKLTTPPGRLTRLMLLKSCWARWGCWCWGWDELLE